MVWFNSYHGIEPFNSYHDMRDFARDLAWFKSITLEAMVQNIV